MPVDLLDIVSETSKTSGFVWGTQASTVSSSPRLKQAMREGEVSTTTHVLVLAVRPQVGGQVDLEASLDLLFFQVQLDAALSSSGSS